MTAVKSLLEQAQNPDFWRSINPELSVSEDWTAKSLSALTVEPEHMKNLLLSLNKDGYFQINSILPESDVLRMSAAVEKIRREGWPPIFAFIYDEFWQTFCRMSQILSTVLGRDYRQLPDFWAWYIDTSNTEKGWEPHRDKNSGTLLPDGMPKSLTMWVALSDATPLNGCMYILPAALDPNYDRKSPQNEVNNIQDIRALPVAAGSVLCWNQAVLHWGSRSSERAPHPRISIAFEFQRGDVEPYNTPLLYPSTPPNFNQRLGLIGKQILQYKHIYHLSADLTELALELRKMLPNHNSTHLGASASEGVGMDNQASEVIEKIRQQFDTGPYPRTPLEQSPKEDANRLFIHNLVTPYYLRNQKVIDTQDKVILDAGCGSGYTSLILAEANPQAKIIGIDLSAESIKLARQRLQYHGFENVEFHVLAIENLHQLGLEFDYINCDEVLYFFPDPAVGLQAMKSVLQPDGIIRANLHSSIQRFYYYRAQELSKMMGLMDENPGEYEIEIVRETMRALKDDVFHKATIWKPTFEQNDELVLMNYLIQGDKGCNIPEMFSFIKAAGLEYISMVNWQQWDLMNLFKAPNDLPVFLGMTLPETTPEEQMHIFELLHPVHRLLDFWCGHPTQAKPFVPLAEWTSSDWQEARVHLHPQLKTTQVREDLIESITNHRPFEISRYLSISTMSPIVLESNLSACLLPLWDKEQPVMSLVERWFKLKPLHPVTLEAVSQKTAFDEVKEFLSSLEVCLYVLLERCA